MKKLLMLVVMLVVAVVAMAQTSNKISYQAVIRDGNNRLVTNSSVDVTVKIHYTSDTYTENFTGVQTNQNGLISLLIGNGTNFSAIDWNTVDSIETSIKVGTEEPYVNKVPVTAVPYALYASDVNPSGAAVKAIYAKIKADSTTVFDTLHTYYYTKAQTDAMLDNYATKDTLSFYYTKSEVDTAKDNIRGEIAAVDNKLDDYAKKDTLSFYYTKSEVDTAKDNIRGEIAAVDNKLEDYAKKDTLNFYYTKLKVDTLLAAKVDTSDLGKGIYTLVLPAITEGDYLPIGEIDVNSKINDTISLPGNPLTLNFTRNGISVIEYNALWNETNPEEVSDGTFYIELGDTLSTQAIVRYINGTRADGDVNDVDSIYNALSARTDVKNALLEKAKQVAINHEQDAIDVAIAYFNNITADQISGIISSIDSTEMASFIGKLSQALQSNLPTLKQYVGALVANVNMTQVGNLVQALSQYVTAAQVQELVNVLSQNISASQVNTLIDAFNAAAAQPGENAAKQLKQRLHDYIYSVAHED